MEASLESIPELERNAMKEYLAEYVYWHQLRCRRAVMFRVEAPQRLRDSIYCRAKSLITAHPACVLCFLGVQC
jgi:hypothetical protein